MALRSAARATMVRRVTRTVRAARAVKSVLGRKGGKRSRRSARGTTEHEIGPWRVRMNLGRKVEAMDRGLENPKHVLDAVGLLVVSQAQKAFREQKFNNVQWKPRQVPNVFGIIADFSQGGTKTPPMRRWQPTPALFDKGALLKSLSYRIKGADTVLAGSWLPYAGKHQYGGVTESLPITAAVQDKLDKFLKRRPTFKGELGWLLNKKFTGQRLKSKVPPRPFVGVTKELQDEISALVGAEIVNGAPRRRGRKKP